jgi:RNA polymerase sigma factor (sigma-70 family)
MLNRQQEVVLPHLCRLIGSPYGGDVTDGELLERFLGRRDAAAFAALVRRHGPTVLGVCRRILRNAHDAEDAFQATFLVLVRNGRSIARREALGSFLYGVAYRVALKARADAIRRRHHERHAARRTEEPAAPEAAGDDLRPILDEEVNRLPDKYRRPIVLCYFEGKTYQEAARLLGWPAGTASTRLARARQLLRARLVRRGLTLSAAALAVRLAAASAAGSEAGLLADATASAALCLAAGAPAAGVSARVLALSQGVVQAMFLRKVQTLTGLLVALGLSCAGAAALWHVAAPAPAAAAADPGTPGGAPPAATDRPGRTEDAGAPPPAADDPRGRAPEAPAGAPPRALAPPGDGARLQTRIGLINMTRMVKGSKHFQALQADLHGRVKQAQEKLEVLKAQMRQAQTGVDDPATPAGRRETSADEVRRLRREIEDEEERAKRTLNKREGDALTIMYREVEEAARRFAQARGLELVLFYNDVVTEADFYNPSTLQRKMSQTGALVPLVVSPGMDITDSVTEALNRAYEATEGRQR